MYKIIDHLYVGTVKCVPLALSAGFHILGACKDPLHRKNARISGSDVDGYLTKTIPKDEPEYYYAERENGLYCNLIDAPDLKYIPDVIIDRALQYIDDELCHGRNVFICCNEGKSRAPSIAFMYLIQQDMFNRYEEFTAAKYKFMSMYPLYSPNKGFLDYTEKFFYEHKKNMKGEVENDG